MLLKTESRCVACATFLDLSFNRGYYKNIIVFIGIYTGNTFSSKADVKILLGVSHIGLICSVCFRER